MHKLFSVYLFSLRSFFEFHLSIKINFLRETKILNIRCICVLDLQFHVQTSVAIILGKKFIVIINTIGIYWKQIVCSWYFKENLFFLIVLVFEDTDKKHRKWRYLQNIEKSILFFFCNLKSQYRRRLTFLAIII